MYPALRKSHRCTCPWPAPTWLALATLLITAILMAMVQLYGDSLTNYNDVCRPLQDLGFSVIPQLGLDWGAGSTDFSNIADIWIIVSYVSFFLIVSFLLPRPLLIVTRFFWVMSINFFLRALTIAMTRYPRLPFAAPTDNYHPANLLLGALLVVVGARTTMTDMMFSGHTLGFITTASFISRYTQYNAWSILYWVFNVVGILALLSVREHYSADVMVAIIVAKLVFWSYHLYLDSEYIRFSQPGVALQGDAQMVLPAHIQDYIGNRIEIQAHEWNHGKNKNTLTVNGVLTQDARISDQQGVSYMAPVVRTNRYSNEGRTRLYKWLRWLDSE